MTFATRLKRAVTFFILFIRIVFLILIIALSVILGKEAFFLLDYCITFPDEVIAPNITLLVLLTMGAITLFFVSIMLIRQVFKKRQK